MGDEVLMEALKSVQHASEPVSEETPVTTPEPELEAGADEGEGKASTTPASEDAPEAPEPDTTPEMPKSVSQAWAAIEDRMSRAEKRERELKSREAALQKHIEQIQAGNVEQQKADFLTGLRKDPLGILQEAGITFQNLAERVMTGTTQMPQEKPTQNGNLTREDVAAIVAEALDKYSQTANQQGYEWQYLQLIDGALAKDEYKLMASFPNAKDEVYQEAIRLSQEKGEVLPPETVIAILQERKRGDLKKLMDLDVVKSALGLGSDQPKVETEQQSNGESGSEPANKTPETLGTEAGITSKPNKPEPERRLTENEVLEQALKAIRR
jgi:hypothetical protein